MPKLNNTRPSLSKSIGHLALGASLTIVIYGCGAQAPSQPAPVPSVQPVSPPVVATPHEVGRAKVTTASFYAPELQGHPTTSGESYNQHAMTAASRTLPIGTHAKVTNLKTGKSVVVRINDHGPFVKGRGIDLSRDAAKHIGIDHRGTAKVSVTRLAGASKETGDSSTDTAKIGNTPNTTSSDSASIGNPPVAGSSAIPGSPGSVGDEPTEKTVSPSE